jgi:hypothetical protein
LVSGSRKHWLEKAISNGMNQVFEAIQRHVIVGDYIKFQLEADADSRLGEIIRCQQQRVKVRLFQVMDSATLQ